eukprot:2897523-Rhodomonas_salina.3
MNICMLAKYGNGGTITAYASTESWGASASGVSSQVAVQAQTSAWASESADTRPCAGCRQGRC